MISQLHHIPNRSSKPRKTGITIVSDYGTSLADVEQILATSASYIDYVCLEPEAFYSQEQLQAKVQLYSKYGVVPFASGLLFEAAYMRNQTDVFFDYVAFLGLQCIEISDGIVELSPEEKAEIIQRNSLQYRVISKIGPRKNDFEFDSESWKKYIETALEADVELLIIEGTESGTSLFYNGAYEVKDSLVYTISLLAPQEKLVWEAPHTAQQLWYAKKYGAEVNLSQIPLQSVLSLEAARTGLNIHTFTRHVPEQVARDTVRKFDGVYNFDWQI